MKSFLNSILVLFAFFPSPSQAILQEIPHSSQLEVNVTLYPDAMALIKERRKAFFKMGHNKLLIRGIPALILMDTFLFKVLPPSPPVNVLEYTFRSSHITRDELLKHSIGEAIFLLSSDFSAPPRPGRLLSLDGKKAIVDSAGVIFSINKELIGFPHLPYTLVAEPLITLKIKSETDGEATFEMGYLTHGFSWTASYTVIVDATEEHLDLNTWISLNNKSGVNIKKAHFRVAQTQSEDEKFYEIQQLVTLTDQSKKNISWFSVKNLSPLKNFYIFPKNNLLLNEEGVTTKIPVENWLSVQNISHKGLGVPLPEGVVKVFKRNADGSLFYVGDNRTSAIPLEKSLSLRIGTTKDIDAEIRQTDYRKLGNQIVESGYRLDLTNKTEAPRKVLIYQDISDNGVILRETHPHTQEGNRIHWTLLLSPHEIASLRYRVRLNVRGES